MNTIPFFFNQCLDKGRLKRMILWSLTYQGEYRTIQLIENLKTLGFQYATYAGVSLSIDDLSIPPKKKAEVIESEAFVAQSVQGAARGNRTAIEGLQSVIDTWHRTSETVKDHVIEYFEATNILNPVYMMAFSGARGNVSQVRQLVGMRGLMADPKGDIIGFPIRSNFREGLTVTEYMISCYGARKGVVDTALRTADAGYLTRRLVDVAQHVVVQKGSCGTRRGLEVSPLYDGGKKVLSLADRLLGRVLAADVYDGASIIGQRNQAISESFALRLSQLSERAPSQNPLTIMVRSPLTCELTDGVCQLCYGWSLAQNSLVTLGEAVGVIAGQSIGEPGTQLTMRTFHTGGVFTGDVQDEFRSPHRGVVHFPEPFQGLLVRTSYGQIAFLVKVAGTLLITDHEDQVQTRVRVPVHTALFVREGEFVQASQLLGQFGDLGGQRNERLETRKIVFSQLDGEVVFQKVQLIQTPIEPPKLVTPSRIHYRVTNALGTVWILSGKYLQSRGNLLNLFKTSGQILETHSLISRISLLSNIEGFIAEDPVRGSKVQEFSQSSLLPPTAVERLQNLTRSTAFTSGSSPRILRIPVVEAGRTISTVNSRTLERCLLCKGTQEIFVLPENSKKVSFSLERSHRTSLSPSLEVFSRPRPLKVKNEMRVSLLYFNAYFKTQLGGKLWGDTFLFSVKNFRGFIFWTAYLQKTHGMVEESKKAYLGRWRRQNKTTKAPSPLIWSSQVRGLRWVQKTEPLYTIQTLQGKQKTVKASISGLLQYKLRSAKKTKPQINKVHVSDTIVLNPLSRNPSLAYGMGTVSSQFENPLSFASQFPFPQKNVYCSFNSKVHIHPGWAFLPSLSSFGRKTFQNSGARPLHHLPRFDGERVTFTPFLVNTTVKVHKKLSSQTQTNRKLYAWVTKNKNSDSCSVPFLGRLRALACLRHPYILNLSALRRTHIQKQIGLFSVLHYAQSPFYFVFTPNHVLLPQTARLAFSKFTGWVYSRSGASLPDSQQSLGSRSRSKKFSLEHLKATFIFLYRPIHEYSLSRALTIKNTLQGYQTFEQNVYIDFRHVSRSTRALTPLWSKQVSSGLLLKSRVKSYAVYPRILVLKKYVPASTFIVRFLLGIGVPGTRTQTPKLEFDPPWNTNTTNGLRWKLSLYQRPKDVIPKDTLLGPKHGMVLAGQPGFVRQKATPAAGEVYTTPNKKCILLRSKDIRAFKIPSSGAGVLPRYKVSVGQMVRYGDEICPGIAVPESGQVLVISGSVITLRKGQPVLFYKSGSLHVKHSQWVNQGHPLVTLTYQRLVTGDIVQGIPKVEQVFEASHSRDIEINLQQLLRATFRSLKMKMVLSLATRQSMEFIQKEIIERIQKIYLSQGVTISDKHFEIIVRQMTSNVKILDPGDTGLFRNEILSLKRAENINAGTWDQKARYEPIVVGISEMALNSQSFLSAASFQETTRILTRDSILRKTDFLRGLKERVILGDLIPAGTGLPEVITYQAVSSQPEDF